MSNESKIIAYEGKSFTVTLQSMVNSTAYGWCLTEMPAGIALFGKENVPVSSGVAPVNEIFELCVPKLPQDFSSYEAELTFQLICLYDMMKTDKEIKIQVQIVPANEIDDSSFVSYSENSALVHANLAMSSMLDSDDSKYRMLYGYPINQRTLDIHNLKYGYPCMMSEGDGYNQNNLKYGYPCMLSGTGGLGHHLLKYGYPCMIGEKIDDQLVKYGYPTQASMSTRSTINTNSLYGYPDQCCNDACNMAIPYGYVSDGTCNAVMPYGYPYYTNGAAEYQNVKYGYPCNNGMLKYGYPCSNDNLKYGYPCNNENLKYGYPCNNENLKYGYPCNGDNLKYGYPCNMEAVTYGYACNN